jgi:hypothetical protein
MLDRIKEIAKNALMLPASWCERDNFLWERSQRLVNNVNLIASLQEVIDKQTDFDRLSLTSAAYFNEAGLASFLKSEKNAPLQVIPSFSVAGNDHLIYLSTEVVIEQLKSLIPMQTINKINSVIVHSYENGQKDPEAIILSDARNLDDMGVVGIFNELKNYLFAGKGINHLLKSWDSKIDYAYWQTRLDESFHFETVREIARKRLYAAHFFMKQLKLEVCALDIEKFIKHQKKKPKQPPQNPEK